jgi:hypothetical protein
MFKSEPFLWIHLAGLAAVPVLLQVVWLGLSLGDPLPFFWLELLILVIVGVVPVFLMQWIRPFDIFSILILSIKPEQITPQQGQILSLFKTKKQRALTVIAGLLMIAALWELYQLAPLAAIASSFLPQSRLIGLLIASVAFLASNLFVQVPVSVLGVLSTSEQQFTATEPYPTEKILKDFTVPGLRVGKILPVVVKES